MSDSLDGTSERGGQAVSVIAGADRATAERDHDQASAGALVTGGDYRALGIVRSLGRHGVPVWVLTNGRDTVAAASRYARGTFTWPGPSEAERVDFLARLGTTPGLKGAVLFPTDDPMVGLVARHHGRLSECFRLTIPAWTRRRRLCDKRLLSNLARDLGIDQPWTFSPTSREELVDLDCPFPVIVKPALREGANPLTVQKAWRATDRQSLLDRYDEAAALSLHDMILIQEVVPGGGESQLSYAGLCLAGRPLAWLVARRTRQFPMEIGRFSTYVESIDEPAVVEPAVRLLQSVRYTGLVEIEFKWDSRDGRHKLLDVNPRVWGWHTLGARAGVDFSYLLWRMVRGEQVPEVRGRPGVRWVMTSRDLPIAALEILRGRLSLSSYLRSLSPPFESAMFAADDPWPWLVDLPLLAYRMGLRWPEGRLTLGGLRRRPVFRDLARGLSSFVMYFPSLFEK